MSSNETQESPQNPSPSSEEQEDWRVRARGKEDEAAERFNENLAAEESDWKVEAKRRADAAAERVNENLAEAKRRGISLRQVLKEKGLI